MDLPRWYDLQEYWADFPPVHEAFAMFAGYRRTDSAAPSSAPAEVKSINFAEFGITVR